MKKKSVAGIVRLYVRNNPLIFEALKLRIINYSILARKINEEVFHGEESVDSIKVALIRESKRLRPSKAGWKNFLKESEVGVYPLVSILPSEIGKEGLLRDRFNIIRGSLNEVVPSSIIVIKPLKISEIEKTQLINLLLTFLAFHNIPLQGIFMLSNTLYLIVRPQYLPETINIIRKLREA